MTNLKPPKKWCIPIRLHPRGGMYTFLGSLLAYFDTNGIPYTDQLAEEYDILFANSFIVPCELVWHEKGTRLNIRVVHRVDGSAWDYGRYDDADEQQARVNLLADQTIFQSQYSYYSTRQKFKVIGQDGPIIYNPVDVELFHPRGVRLDMPSGIHVCNASYSTNRKKGTWQISELAACNPDIVFVLCGRYENLPSLPNIHFLGHLDRTTLAQVMRSCDVFLNLSENESCPNVVLEALASGLPVLYIPSGGAVELVRECGLPVSVDTFRDGLEQIMQKHAELSLAARQRAVECFSPDVIFPQYLEAAENAVRRPLPTIAGKVNLYRRLLPMKLRRGFRRFHR